MADIIDLAMPFFGIVLLGFLAARFFGTPEDKLRWLNTFVIYFSLPSLIYLTIAQAPFEQLTDWPFVTATTAATFIAFAVVFGGSLLLGADVRRAALQGTAGSYGNVGYMGLPLAVSFFGPEALVPATLVFCFDCALQFVLTPLLASAGPAEEGVPRDRWGIAKQIAKSILTHPFIIATVLGGLASAFHFTPPRSVGTLLDMLSKAAGPCALFALGVTVGLRRFAKMGAELPLIVGMKIFAQPVLVWLTLGLIAGGTDPLWMHVALMMAALPTATNAFILASQYHSFVDGASTSILVTTLLSAITVPVLIYAIEAGCFDATYAQPPPTSSGSRARLGYRSA